MKKILFIYLWILCFALSASAQVLEQTFDQGNKHYSEGNYKEASINYQKVIDTGYGSADLYFNLGNALYKQKMFARAILNYERALKLSPSNGNIKDNLELARLQSRDKIEVLPTFFLTEWFNAIKDIFSANGWAWVSLVSILLCCGLFIVYRFTGTLTTKKIAFSFSALFLVLFGFAVWNSSVKTEQIKHPNTAIIMNPSVVVKSSPDERGKDLFVLHEGTKITLTKTLPVAGWREVKIADGNSGWIESKAFEII